MLIQSILTFSINILFYATIVIIILAILYFNIRIAKLILLNCVTLLLFIIPYFLLFNNFYEFTAIPTVAVVGLLILPITYTWMILYIYNLLDDYSLFPAYIAIISALFILVIFPAHTIKILSILHLMLCAYIIYLLSVVNLNISSRFLIAVQVLTCINIILSFFNSDAIHFITSPALLVILTFYILTIEYQQRLIRFIRQLNNSNELNKKLTHQITRLKQSNEQCRRIIAEKDTELFQISRHASLAEVTTGIAHELAQPLTGIKGIAQNMIDDINYDELDKLQAVAELQRISSLVDKSSTIIDHIRNFSKKSGFSMRIIDLNNSILEAIDLIHHQLKKNNIDLLCDLHENIQGVYGDTISIEQLIVNLVLNAKDAIIEKKHLDTDHEGLIKITTSVNNHKVRLIIKDNGIGIPKDIIPKIWSPFFTSKKRNHGTGIGLSICSKIIKEHNAEVTLDTNSGGTTFTIDFPIPEESQ